MCLYATGPMYALGPAVCGGARSGVCMCVCVYMYNMDYIIHVMNSESIRLNRSLVHGSIR